MGKSTTLKTIMGLVKAKSGSVFFEGNDLTGLPPFKIALAGIGYVPEERRIFGNLTVRDNLLLAIKNVKGKNATDPNIWTEKRIYDHFPKLGERCNLQGRFLSGGEQQMLSIGRALMGNPRLLLVDEPAEGLAPIMVEEVRVVLNEINKSSNVSILLVEHNLKMALSLADRVYLMGKSHIGYSGFPDDVRVNHDLRAKYLEV